MSKSIALDQIKGIGPATAEWLTETFGVTSVADLAALDLDLMGDRLRQELRPGVSQAAIERWITEAGNLQDIAKPVASFVVEFQSTTGDPDTPPDRMSVHHVETDHTEVWNGVDLQRLAALMTARLPTASTADETPAFSPSAPDVPSGPVELRATIAMNGDDAPGGLLDVGAPWSVVFDWSTDARIDGEWTLDAVFTPIGRGAPIRPRSSPVRVAAVPGQRRYQMRLQADARTRRPIDALFRGTATLTYRPAGADHPVLAAFADLGVLSFWSPISA
jgi:hypothetical protein